MSGDGHIADDVLRALASGALDAASRDEARRHVDGCTRCKGKLADLSETTAPQGRPLITGEVERTKASDPLLGQMLGEYKVLDRIGQGGMGILYRGVQPVIGKAVAIKVLLPQIAADVTVVERMIREAQAVNAIRHPSIVDIFSFGRLPDGRPYLVMELLQGVSLNALLQQRKRLTVPETLQVLAQAATALDAAHSVGVVHRDLKSDNVFVDARDDPWRVTLIDFGLAKREGVGQNLTSPGTVMGTPAYMAPEQVRGAKEITPKTDVYSLGILAWALLSGREPWLEGTMLDVMGHHLKTVAPKVNAPNVPPALAQLIADMLEKDPARRPTAEQVKLRIAAVKSAPAPVPRSRATAVALGAVGVLALGLAAIAGWLHTAEPEPVALPESVLVPVPVEPPPVKPMEVAAVEPPPAVVPPPPPTLLGWPCAKVRDVGALETFGQQHWSLFVVTIENESNLVVTGPGTKAAKRDLEKLRKAISACRKTTQRLEATQTTDQTVMSDTGFMYRGVFVEGPALRLTP